MLREERAREARQRVADLHAERQRLRVRHRALATCVGGWSLLATPAFGYRPTERYPAFLQCRPHSAGRSGTRALGEQRVGGPRRVRPRRRVHKGTSPASSG
jgi:hypothetical protein